MQFENQTSSNSKGKKQGLVFSTLLMSFTTKQQIYQLIYRYWEDVKWTCCTFFSSVINEVQFIYKTKLLKVGVCFSPRKLVRKNTFIIWCTALPVTLWSFSGRAGILVQNLSSVSPWTIQPWTLLFLSVLWSVKGY